ncbi:MULTISPECIES: FAD-dependent oxidoreductase [unclassified Luteococcus]|uniref:FAD-dependent oxidoreductase n=1 Tax=unclassified Luteococcus TaxID=2639923 RepID=UPI00313E4AE3
MRKHDKGVTATTADVLVIGGGGSGLAAAIEAAEQGASVLVLETGEELRGSTGRSVGSIAASCTPDQRQQGIQDSPEEHLRDYRKLSGALAEQEDPELVELLIHNVTATLAWLRGMGMEFYGPVGEPPHSVPRLHNILPGSRAYIHHLARRARSVGVQVLLGTPVEALLSDHGRIVGVRASGREYRAERAVVIASGDFSASEQMKTERISPRVAGFQPVNPLANGDGQRMAEAVGATVLNADLFDVPSMRLSPPASEGLYGLVQKVPPVRTFTGVVRWSLANLPNRLVRSLMMGFVTTFLSPRESMFTDGAILVDRAGRLRSETEENINLSVAALGGQGGFLIGDATLYQRYDAAPNHVATAPGVAHAYMSDFKRARRDVYTEAPTLDGLATSLGLPPQAVAQAVEEGNERKRARGGPELGRGPWFALGPLHAFLIQTNGGLAVNRDLAVLDASHQAIPGLFAAGNAGQGGLALFGHGHHLGWAFTSGRLAGRSAAHQPRQHEDQSTQGEDQ